MKLIIFLCLLNHVLGFLYPENNVCPSIPDYNRIKDNSNCWYDPDVNATVPQLLVNHGLTSETYNVTTLDGFVIQMFRLVSSKPATRGSILFFPGLTRDCRSFVLQKENSSAIYYSNLGFDVWLANPRGSEYSSHTEYSRDDREFWDWSFHEMGIYDFPAQVEKISEVTGVVGRTKIVGHVMGNTAAFIYCSMNVTHCQKNIDGIIALSPLTNMFLIQSPILYVLLNLGGPTHIPTDIFEICQGSPFIGICDFVMQTILGPSNPNILPEMFPIFTNSGNCPISVKVANHYAQIINSGGKFRQFNYFLDNFNKYGSLHPPTYDTSKIPCNVTLISANKDFIATEADIQVLFNSLPLGKKVWYKLPENATPDIAYSHLDVVIGAPSTVKEIQSKMNIALGV